jgi:hypothetical protein
MTIREQQPKPEKMSALVREAVKLVPVGEFLQLKFQEGSFLSDPVEQAHILNGAYAIQKCAEERGETYRLGDEIEPSGDLRVKVARKLVRNISVEQYLPIRHKELEAVIVGIIRGRNEFELLGAEKVEKENKKLKMLLDDINLTNSVIAAVKIKLS